MDEQLHNSVAQMPQQVYQRLVTASETGKWPDGVRLTFEQREHCLQLVLLWQALHNQTPQHMTLAKGGELVMKSKTQLKQELAEETSIIRLKLD